MKLISPSRTVAATAALLLLLPFSGCKKEKTVFLGIEGTPSSESRQDFPYEFVPKLLGGKGQVVFTLSNHPSWMGVDTATGRIYGLPSATGEHKDIRLVVSDSERAAEVVFSIKVEGDPLAQHAWHLENTGQRNFAASGGVAGADMKVKAVHRLGVTGKGVLVAVSDSGLEISHPDLRNNVREDLSKNYALEPPYFGDPTNDAAKLGDHGTSVAGIIAAEGWNSRGSRGVAPDAELAGVNFLKSDDDGTTFHVGLATLLDQAASASGKQEYDVFNQSWGPADFAFTGLDGSYLDQLLYGVTKHRGGKGSIYVRSAGNEGAVPARATLVDNVPLSSNVHEHNATPYTIVVSAIAADGERASYSSWGSNVWVSAPGGEYGTDEPAIMTTDQQGCDTGYAQSSVGRNSFDRKGSGNGSCDYVSSFNGTSSAAPNTSGVVALMLEANPNLSWRDVKHILAGTATKVDPNRQDTVESVTLGSLGIKNLNYQFTIPGWTTNAAGYQFHDWYGFGLVNAEAAVSIARNYTSPLGELRQTVTRSGNCESRFCSDDTWRHDSGPLNLSIPGNGNAVTHTISGVDSLVVEAVQVRMSMMHLWPGDVSVVLISPSGTRSTLLFPSALIEGVDMTDQLLLSNAFYGEDSGGDWTLEIRDLINGDTGTLTNWKINILGH